VVAKLPTMATLHNLITIPVLLVSTLLVAQTGTGYYEQQVEFRSDYPPQYVSVTNKTPMQAVLRSPFIGVSQREDSAGTERYQSFLGFPGMFVPYSVQANPALITKAELLLYPIYNEADPDFPKTARFQVKRVVEDWTDTATVWMQQPTCDSVYAVREQLRKKQKHRLLSVDVTGLVMDMVRYGNYGFALSPDSLADREYTRTQWFASPWFGDPEKRPLLVIHYRVLANPLAGEPVPIQLPALNGPRGKTDVEPRPVLGPTGGSGSGTPIKD